MCPIAHPKCLPVLVYTLAGTQTLECNFAVSAHSVHKLLGPSPTRASDCAKAFAQRKEPALSLVRDCPSFVTPTIFAFCSLSVKQKNMGYWKPTLNFSKPRSELSSSILTNIWRCTRAFCGRQRSIFYRAMRVKRGGACGWSPRTRVSELGRDMVSSV